jgi:hypothetical protein
MRHFKGSLPLKLISASNGKEYTIRLARPSGGKAGKGHNKTSTVQVWYDNCMVVKQIRFTVREHETKMNAIEKAISYVSGQKIAKEYFSDLSTVIPADDINDDAFPATAASVG